MKRFFPVLCLLATLMLALPMAAQADSGVRATLAGSEVWVDEGEVTTVKIDVLNTSADSVTVTSYAVNGQTDTVSTPISAGAAYRFYVKTAIEFGDSDQKSLIASVSLKGGGTIYSNATVLYKKTSVPVRFSVDPVSVVASSGETVEYAIAFTNAIAFDYTDVTISLDGAQIVPAFACAAGESQTFDYSKTYTQPAEHVFSYTFGYLQSDGSTGVSGGSERALVSIRLPQPSGTLIEGTELLPGVLTAMVGKDSVYSLKLYLKNNSESELSAVHVYDQNGTDFGGWSKIGIGQTAGMTIDLSPVEETTYTFTAYGKDASGDMRMVRADSVVLAVGILPDETVNADAGAPVDNPQSSAAALAEATTDKNNYIILGIVIGAIVLALVLIMLIAASRKNIVRKNPKKKKTAKSKSGRNYF